jgi:hypothetical protein
MYVYGTQTARTEEKYKLKKRAKEEKCYCTSLTLMDLKWKNRESEKMGKRVKSIWQPAAVAAASTAWELRQRKKNQKCHTINVLGVLFIHTEEAEAAKTRGEKWKKCIFQNSCTTAQKFLLSFCQFFLVKKIKCGKSEKYN